MSRFAPVSHFAQVSALKVYIDFLAFFCYFSSKIYNSFISMSFCDELLTFHDRILIHDEVSTFSNRILTNQKQEVVIRSFQWNCSYMKISGNNLLKLFNFNEVKEQLIDLNKNYALRSNTVVLPKAFPFAITSKSNFIVLQQMTAKKLRIATMKRQMLLKPELQIDVTIVS